MDNDYNIKRNKILEAFKWRDNIKKKSDNELYGQLLLFILYVSFISNMKYFYINYNIYINKPILIIEDLD